jgi:hypothetical protein
MNITQKLSLDIKSRKCLREIRKVVKGLEAESVGLYKWQYCGLETLGLTEPEALADEYILINNKKSKLQSRERDLVAGIVGVAIVKALKK